VSCRRHWNPPTSRCGPAGLDAQLPPMVQAAADLLEPVAKCSADRLLLIVGALFDAQPPGASLAGEAAVADPAAALELGERAVRGIWRPAGGGVGQQRHSGPQLGQDVHLDCVQASRGSSGHVAVAAVLADQAAGPPLTWLVRKSRPSWASRSLVVRLHTACMATGSQASRSRRAGLPRRRPRVARCPQGEARRRQPLHRCSPRSRSWSEGSKAATAARTTPRPTRTAPTATAARS
jgi:hypothetical protein